MWQWGEKDMLEQQSTHPAIWGSTTSGIINQIMMELFLSIIKLKKKHQEREFRVHGVGKEQ